MSHRDSVDREASSDHGRVKPRLMLGALAGGVVMGVPSALPGFGCCCMLWSLIGGFVAAFLASRTAPRYEARDGAVAGIAAAGWGIVFHTVVSVPLNLLLSNALEVIKNDTLIEDSSSEVLKSLQEWSDPSSVIGILIGGAITLVVFAGSSSLGGLVAGSIICKLREQRLPRE